MLGHVVQGLRVAQDPRAESRGGTARSEGRGSSVADVGSKMDMVVKPSGMAE